MGRYTNPRVRIYNDALTLQGTITTVLHMEYECVLNEIGVGAFVIPLVDTPGRALAIENNLAVFTVEIDSTETAFGWIVITDIDDKTREAAGELVVTGYGIMHKLTYDRMNYTVISDGSGGKTSTARLDVLALSQYAWTVNSTTYNPSPRTAGAKLVPANETLFEALLQAGAQDQYNWLDRPEYPPAHRANSVKDMDHLDDDPDPIVSSYSVHFRPDADDTNTDHIPLADGGIKIKTNRSQVPTRAYIYGGGGGQDRFTIEEADGYITPPSGFSFDFATSEVINDTLEAISNQPVISDNKNFPDIKPEDPTDITTVRASAVALCEAGLTYLLARQQSNDTFYDIAPTFVGKVVWPGRDFCRLTYSKTSPYNAAGSEVTTTIIDIDIATHILGVKYTFGGDNVLMGSFSLGPAPRLVRTGMNETVERIQNVEKRLDHLTASASISNPSPTQTYANSDGTYLVVSTNSVLTNERQFAAGNGLTASDGGANSTYTVNVGAGDGIDIAADSIAVDVTDLIGTGLTEEATNNIAVDFTVVAAQADLHDRQHSITSASDHTVTGSALDVVGLTAANTLGILTPSAAVSSATSVLLKTDSNGRFQVQGVGVGAAAGADAITVGDDVWIGLGASAGRIVFDNQTNDQIEIADASVIVNGTTLDSNIAATTTNAMHLLDTDLTISNSAVSTGTLFTAVAYGTSIAGTPRFIGRSARGTRGTPTATQSGDTLAKFGGSGFDGSNFSDARAYISMLAGSTFTPSAQGARMLFYTTEGTGTTEALRVSIEGNGDFIKYNATENLKIVDAGSTGASASGSVTDWIQVQVGATTGYLKVYNSK